jgi:hypothetical protein
MPTLEELELAACSPNLVSLDDFNSNADLPYGLEIEHIYSAMNEYINFLSFINQQLNTKGIERFESMLMQANFSSMVGEFMGSTIPKYCKTIVKNKYHNGHPDLLPAGMYPDDKMRHAPEGIEIKGSRQKSGWQGHNAEDTWLMVFVFDSNTPVDPGNGIAPKSFRFVKVVGARIEKEDWTFSGRSETSRRTITASVNRSGYEKMSNNWIYKAPTTTSQTEANLLDLIPPE